MSVLLIVEPGQRVDRAVNANLARRASRGGRVTRAPVKVAVDGMSRARAAAAGAVFRVAAVEAGGVRVRGGAARSGSSVPGKMIHLIIRAGSR